MQGTGLEDVGIAGQAYLRDALTSCTDPLQAIEEFQVMPVSSLMIIFVCLSCNVVNIFFFQIA